MTIKEVNITVNVKYMDRSVVFYESIALLFLILLAPAAACCQNASPINTDRPDQSDGTYILTPKKFQLESGIIFSQSSGKFTGITHTNMIRYGVSKTTEFRLLTNEGITEGEGSKINNFVLYPALLSAKHAIFPGRKNWPAITGVAYLGLPFGATKQYQLKRFAPALALAFENDFTDKISLGYNLGITRNGIDKINYYSATASLSDAFSAKFSLFAEYFSRFNRVGFPSHNMDGGFEFLIKPRLQLDAAAGTSLFDNGGAVFETTGISYRFD